MKYFLLLLSLYACPLFAEELASVYDLDSSWTNQNGDAVRLDDLRGKPRVICMFFSNCGYACPLITADMKALESSLAPEQRGRVGFVMASFDVERDTPDKLRVFAETKELGSDWQLLHGDENAVRELAAALNVRYRKEPDGNFAHSNIITILDAEGHLVHQREGLGGDLGEIINHLNAVNK